jgi:DNA repair protein RadC
LKTEELIAILLRVGMKGRSAVQVAQDLLQRYENRLDILARQPWGMLAKVAGIGPDKATQLAAAFELAARVAAARREGRVIQEPSQAAEVVRERLQNLSKESFRVLLLNTKNELIAAPEVSLGSANASIVEPREVFREAISFNATSVILAHNHPSGDPTPSSEDIAITKRLAKAGELLGIAVLDHIIVGRRDKGGEQDFVSLKELGLM